MKKIVFIGGPTASGKTELAISIAKKFNGELINADSRQIYKYLDIGTNKGSITANGTQNFINDIPIHLVSFLNPDKRYSVFEFKEQAYKLIDQITEQGKLPIIVGGTGLYIDSILKNYSQTAVSNPELREELEKLSINDLQNVLKRDYPEAFEKLNQSDKHNPQRLVRLIEKQSAPIIEHQKIPNFDYIFLYPKYDWQVLTQKIDQRVEQMFKDGLVQEVEKVLSLGYTNDSPALKGTGYKEVIDLLNKNISLQECINLVKISHRQYAKRQRTWFEGEGREYNLIKVENAQQAQEVIKNFYDTTSN